MAPSNTSKIPIGTMLADKYRVTREIGRGGMAAVYEAENVHIGKRVAVKVLAAELISSTIVVERFLREARAAASISSPYICDVYDSGKLQDGRPFLVLELLEGESLYERMTRVRQIDLTTTLQMVSQVARGLTKAHAAGVVHRDLKPENIFLTKDEEGRLLCKILDFGLAKFYAPVTEDGPQARLTREGAVFGTPAYMSPEQVKGQGQVDHRADLWALGCITYESLTGRTVWSTEQGVAMTFAQIASAPLPNALVYRTDLPPSFQVWFAKALDRSADHRFQSAKELAEDLASALSDSIPGVISLMSLADVASKPMGAPRAPTPPANLPAERPKPPAPAPEPPKAAAAPATEAPAGTAQTSSPPPSSSRPASRVGATSPVTRGGRSSAGSPLSSTVDREETALARSTQRRARRARLTLVGVAAITAGGYLGWLLLLRPAAAPVTTVASATPSAAPSAAAAPSAEPPTAKGPKWAALVGSAQGQIAASSLVEAAKTLKEASEMAGGGPPRIMLEQVQIAAATKGICRVTALARPRPYGLSGAAGRPTIAFTPRGALVSWTDDHESAGHDHAYAVLLDPAMRAVADPRDITPEAGSVQNPQLFAVGDKVGLVYADARGTDAGIRVRWLDGEGRIATPARPVTTRRPSSSPPAIDRATDGSYWLAWEDERPTETSDLYLRHLSADFEPLGGDLRMTDFVIVKGAKPHVRSPSIGVSGGFLNVVFRFEREPLHLLWSLRLRSQDPALTKGLEPSTEKGPPKDRLLGEVSPVNNDKEKAETPKIECVAEGCYLVWHTETGAYGAFLESSHGQILWRKRLDRKGAHPSLAIAPSGSAELAWYAKGRLMLGSIGRDGVGAPTAIARVNGDPPAPSLSPGGAPGEWYVAWLESEAGHPEVYAARALCK
jgi:serine/threonine-protein kinase